ncbi:hypothetical protein E1J25_19085 [Xanthomonas hortorum pv. taraxaci]|nr:hypothetical protein [Xanthomonas hortorum pv. taraxaci]
MAGDIEAGGGISGVGSRESGVGSRDSGFGIRDSGFGFRVSDAFGVLPSLIAIARARSPSLNDGDRGGPLQRLARSQER